jgi:phage tail tape-measure protein
MSDRIVVHDTDEDAIVEQQVTTVGTDRPDHDEEVAGAVGGAVTGAVVGSVVPGIGTAVGAVVGGAVGALAGKAAEHDDEMVVKTTTRSARVP